MTAGAVTTYLEITDPAQLKPAPAPDVETTIDSVHDWTVNRDLYAQIGKRWQWTDRLPWTDDQWKQWAQRVETWVAAADGRPAGYYELDAIEADVEIAIFGLLGEFHGRGLGGRLLTHAIERGFDLGERVWVHTCTHDGPHALANYEARGMRVERVDAGR